MSGLVLILTSWMAVTPAPPVSNLVQEPVSQWIPADTAIVIEVNHAGQWSQDFGEDQLGQLLVRFTPARRFLRDWQRMQNMLEQTGSQMVNDYFGKSVIFLAAHSGTRTPMVIISQLREPKLSQTLIEKLHLEHRETFKDHEIYQTPDGGAIVSVHQSSAAIILTSERNTAYLKRLILAAESEPLLKDNKAFTQFHTQLPTNTVLKGFIRSGKSSQQSFFVTNDRQSLRATYTGNMPSIAKVLSHFGSQNAPDFGPIPSDCMAAISLNLDKNNTTPPQLLSKIIAPQTYATDLHPKLGNAMVLFLKKPVKKQMFPSVGIALQMKDQTLASDLDTIMKNVMVVSTMTLEKKRSRIPRSNDQPVTPIQPKLVTHNKTAYRIAPPANIKMMRQGIAMVTPIQLSWGRINDWYVVSSDKQTFCACVDSIDAKQTTLKTSIQKTNVAAIEKTNKRIAEFQIQPHILIEHLKRFIPDQTTPKAKRHRIPRNAIRIDALCNALSKYSNMRISVYRDAQDQLISHMELTKKH